MDLEKDPGIIFKPMDGVRQPLQPLDMRLRGKTDLPDIPLALRREVGPLYKNQADSPLRPFPVVGDQFIGDRSLFRGVVHRHLGHRQTVLEGEAPDPAGLKHGWITHCRLISFLVHPGEAFFYDQG
jgi:hypothetical protein